jgi:hypothetical protein
VLDRDSPDMLSSKREASTAGPLLPLHSPQSPLRLLAPSGITSSASVSLLRRSRASTGTVTGTGSADNRGRGSHFHSYSQSSLQTLILPPLEERPITGAAAAAGSARAKRASLVTRTSTGSKFKSQSNVAGKRKGSAEADETLARNVAMFVGEHADVV